MRTCPAAGAGSGASLLARAAGSGAGRARGFGEGDALGNHFGRGGGAARAHGRDGQRDIAPVLARFLRHHGAPQQLQLGRSVFVASVEPRFVSGFPARGGRLIGENDFRRSAAGRVRRRPLCRGSAISSRRRAGSPAREFPRRVLAPWRSRDAIPRRPSHGRRRRRRRPRSSRRRRAGARRWPVFRGSPANNAQSSPAWR